MMNFHFVSHHLRFPKYTLRVMVTSNIVLLVMGTQQLYFEIGNKFDHLQIYLETSCLDVKDSIRVNMEFES